MKLKQKIVCRNCGKELTNSKDMAIPFDPSNIAITKRLSNWVYCKKCFETFDYVRKERK